MDALLEIEDLKKYYGKEPNQTKALNGITFQVMPGEFLGIMGSSGSGDPAGQRQDPDEGYRDPEVEGKKTGRVPWQRDRISVPEF